MSKRKRIDHNQSQHANKRRKINNNCNNSSAIQNTESPIYTPNIPDSSPVPLYLPTYPRNDHLYVPTYPRDDLTLSAISQIKSNSCKILRFIGLCITYLTTLHPMNFDFKQSQSRFCFGFGGPLDNNDKLRKEFWMFLDAHKIKHQISDGRPTDKFGNNCFQCGKETHWLSNHYDNVCSFTLSINNPITFSSNIEEFTKEAMYQFGRKYEKITYKFLQDRSEFSDVIWVNEISECKLSYDMFGTAFDQKWLIEVKATNNCHISNKNSNKISVRYVISNNEFVQAKKTQYYMLAAHVEMQEDSIFQIMRFQPPNTFKECLSRVPFNQQMFEVSIPNSECILKSKFQIKKLFLQII